MDTISGNKSKPYMVCTVCKTVSVKTTVANFVRYTRIAVAVLCWSRERGTALLPRFQPPLSLSWRYELLQSILKVKTKS